MLITNMIFILILLPTKGNEYFQCVLKNNDKELIYEMSKKNTLERKDLPVNLKDWDFIYRTSQLSDDVSADHYFISNNSNKNAIQWYFLCFLYVMIKCFHTFLV